LLAILCCGPAAAADQPKLVIVGGDANEVLISEQGDVSHKAANFQFPPEIGDMPLRKVVIYGRADVSADYTLRGGGNGDAWITFFVYPAGHPFVDEVADVEKSLTDKWNAARIAPPAQAPAAAADGASGWFEGTFDGLHAKTGYILVQRGSWFLETRCTIPDAAGAEGVERTVRALEFVPWSWRPDAPPAVGYVTSRLLVTAR
jgi:hypothetical protein